jgi:hypothetical protein
MKKNTSVFFIQLQRLNQTYNVEYFMKIVNNFVEGLCKKCHLVFEKIQVHLFLYVIQRNHFFEVPNNYYSCKCGRGHFDDISHVHSFEDTTLPNEHEIINIAHIQTSPNKIFKKRFPSKRIQSVQTFYHISLVC